jgi:hypothetical protein
VRAIVGCQPRPDLPGPALGPNGPGTIVTVPWWVCSASKDSDALLRLEGLRVAAYCVGFASESMIIMIAYCVGFASMIIAYCVGFASMIIVGDQSVQGCRRGVLRPRRRRRVGSIVPPPPLRLRASA